MMPRLPVNKPRWEMGDLTEGCDAVLQMHFLYAGADRRERGADSLYGV